MTWFVIALIVVFIAVYVYFSVLIAAGMINKITNIEKQVADLYENDEWCENEIKALSKTSDDLYSTHMVDTAAIWKKFDEQHNDINRAKMRIGKLEQHNEKAS